MNSILILLFSWLLIQVPEGKVKVLAVVPDPPLRAQVPLPLVTLSGSQFICGKYEIVQIDLSGKVTWERKTSGSEILACDVDSHGRLYYIDDDGALFSVLPGIEEHAALHVMQGRGAMVSVAAVADGVWITSAYVDDKGVRTDSALKLAMAKVVKSIQNIPPGSAVYKGTGNRVFLLAPAKSDIRRSVIELDIP